MKRNERHQQNGVEERAVVSTETLHLDHYSAQLNTYSYSMTVAATRQIEENLKIGRRYSFDDNGGGYQGL
jgi:hypothetical protein